MLAKLIVHAPTREAALRKLDNALSEFVVLGVTTNVGFLREVSKSEVFSNGLVTTDYLDNISLEEFEQPGISDSILVSIAAGASRFDAERFGVFFRSSPRQCDVLLVNGPISKKFADPIVRLWEQMPEPKWCIAMGECAISGGPYFQSYNILEGVDTIIPVDVYIPGCPPRPEALIDGFGKLREKIIRIGAMPSHSRLESEAPVIIGDA